MAEFHSLDIERSRTESLGFAHHPFRGHKVELRLLVTNFLISHGHATRSTFACSLVIHFMPAPLLSRPRPSKAREREEALPHRKRCELATPAGHDHSHRTQVAAAQTATSLLRRGLQSPPGCAWLLVQLLRHRLPLVAHYQGDLRNRMTILEGRKDAHRTKSRIALQDFRESRTKRLLRL